MAGRDGELEQHGGGEGAKEINPFRGFDAPQEDVVPPALTYESGPQTIKEPVVPKNLVPRVEQKPAPVQEQKVETLSPDVALGQVLKSLKKEYPTLEGKYMSIFREDYLNWNFNERRLGDEIVPENPGDVADLGELMAIDAQAKPHTPEQEKKLEGIILRILERKSGKESVWKRTKRSLIDLLSR